MRTLKKIEKLLIAIPIALGFVNLKADINTPKKKDYLGRVILSLAGLIMLIMLVSIILLFIFQYI